MGKNNKNQQFHSSPEFAPETLEDHPFYGLTLDPEQKIFRDHIWDPKTIAVFCNSKAGTGKAQPLNTLIPTPDGYRYLGDIKVGDYVFDRLGNPTKVLGVYPQGKQRAYKITLHDGRSTICGPEHLWTFTCDGCRGKFRTESLSQMLQRSVRTNSRGSRYKIPNNEPVHYSPKNYLVDPYVVGVFLGNECCRENYLSISNPEVDIVNEVAYITHSKAVKYSDTNYTWYFKDLEGNNLIKTDLYFKNIADALIQYSYNKRIPTEYLYGSIDQRFSLLQGLMDTDGAISPADGRYNARYSTTSYNLALDIMQLCYSLGLSVSLTLDNRAYKYTTNEPAYNIHFRIPNEIKPLIFRKSKKKEIAMESLNFEKSRIYSLNNIVDIEDLGYDDEMVCIYVDNPEHLYLTNDFIVTHNTTIALGTANLLVQYGFYEGIIYIMAPTQEQRQGFLPGGVEEKNAPYMQPLVDAMNSLGIPPYALQCDDNLQAMKSGDAYIQFTVDTYLRGCNFENKVVIVDESQNYHFDELKKTLTRMHDNNKVIIIGHTGQCDLYKHPERSGFAPYLNAFARANDPRVAICELKTNHRGWFSTFCDDVEI